VDAGRGCCPLGSDGAAGGLVEVGAGGGAAGGPGAGSPNEQRIRAALREGSALVRRDLPHQLGRPVPDEIQLCVVGPVIAAAEASLFRTDALGPHSIAELHDAYAGEIDAAQDRWFERLRPLLLAVIEAALPDLEAELYPAIARFASAHRGLTRP
jgi:hypothetical protein